MRRFKQMLSEECTRQILTKQSNGVLSLTDPDGKPYGVPLSFAYDGDGSIYFHSAVKGHKIDCIGDGNQCSFCVIDRDTIVPEEFTTYFRSVIVFGKISIVLSKSEIMHGLKLLCEKYSPDIDSTAEINRCLNNVIVLRLDISSMTGKESIELVRARNQRDENSPNQSC